MSSLSPPQNVIGRTGADHVSISVSGRSDDWISATIGVRAAAWSGNCRAGFHQGELLRFAAEIDRLYRDLTGVAELSPIEPYLSLKRTGDGKGHVLVEGKARDGLSYSTYLAFRFEIDQTDLSAIVRGMQAADPA